MVQITQTESNVLHTVFKPSPTDLDEQGIVAMPIPGMFFVASKKHTDDRGYYSELSRIPELDPHLPQPLIARQVNLARSEKNVARGIHAEDWNKLVTVTHGVCFCAFVDLRPNSPTFTQVTTVVLGHGTDATFGSVYVPTGIGNSLCVLEGPVDYLYIVDRLYKERDPAGDQAFSLFDPDLAIPWPLPTDQMILSQRDRASITLREKYPNHFGGQS